MKKQEIKKDVIRERIISVIRYLEENRSIFYSTISVVALCLIVFIIYNKKSESKKNNSNLVSSTAQNYFLNDQIELSKDKFTELLDGKYNQEARNQAIIYLLKDALDNNDNKTIEMLLSEYKFKTNDDMLYSLYNKIKGDYYFNNKDFEDAINYYSKSLKYYNKYIDILIDAKISLIECYKNINMLSKMKDIIESINESDLSVQSKNKFELYVNSLQVIK